MPESVASAGIVVEPHHACCVSRRGVQQLLRPVPDRRSRAEREVALGEDDEGGGTAKADLAVWFKSEQLDHCLLSNVAATGALAAWLGGRGCAGSGDDVADELESMIS